MTSGAQPLAEVTRRDERSGTEHVESRHVGHVVVTIDGEVVLAHGDADRPTFPRSAVKPAQAVVCLEVLADAGWPGGEPTDAEVALGWASHRAEDRHLDQVLHLLARADAAPAALTCPPDERPDGPPGKQALHHNCSGKHALFALAGRALGIEGAALLDPEGPLQSLILAELEHHLGPISAVGVDGCGAPAVEAPLVGLANLFEQVAGGERFARVRAGGLAHPGLVGGRGRLESGLLSAGTLAKVGAEGVYGAGWVGPGGRVGVAVKAEDGAVRGAATALVAVVEAAGRPIGAWEPERPLGGGRPAGVVRPAPALLAALEDVALA